jgi:hypothetical protein
MLAWRLELTTPGGATRRGFFVRCDATNCAATTMPKDDNFEGRQFRSMRSPAVAYRLDVQDE